MKLNGLYVNRSAANSGVNIGDVTLTAGSNLVGRVGHDITGISSGRKVVATPQTELALVASATPCKMVIITSETNNTGKIAIGATGATDATAGTESGTILYAGERFIFYIDDAADLFVDAEVAGDGVAYTILT